MGPRFTFAKFGREGKQSYQSYQGEAQPPPTPLPHHPCLESVLSQETMNPLGWQQSQLRTVSCPS